MSRQERPAEGPHEGGTSHLCDEVCIDVCAVNDNWLLFADAKDVAKALGGWVGRCPGPTMTLAICHRTTRAPPPRHLRPHRR